MGNETSKGDAKLQEETRAFTHVLREANIGGADWDDLEDAYHDHVWTERGANGELNTGEQIAAEFDMLQRRELQRTTAAEAENCFSRAMANQDKNRYKNVLPFDATRVLLKAHKPHDGEEWDDLSSRRGVTYINANWVNLDASLKEITEPYDDCDFRPNKKGKGAQLPGARPDEKKSSLRFIACQAPTKSTIEDFMRMTWEHDCRVIVMLTRLNEGGRAKADLYWEQEPEHGPEESDEDHDDAFWVTEKDVDPNAEAADPAAADPDAADEGAAETGGTEPAPKEDAAEAPATKPKRPDRPAPKGKRSASKAGALRGKPAAEASESSDSVAADAPPASAAAAKSPHQPSPKPSRKREVIPGEHLPFVAGDYSMQVMSEESRCDGAYIVRTIKLKLRGPLAKRIVVARTGVDKKGKQRIHSVSRTIKQFHFVSWPDHGVPHQTGPLLQMMKEVNEAARDSEDASKARLEGTGKKKKPKPVVVHCSAGIGRTGTFILIDTVQKALTHAFKKNPDIPPVINLMQLVDQMRSMRTGMLTAIDQYIYCYKTIYAHLCSLNNE